VKTPPAKLPGAASGRGLRILVLQSRFNETIVDGLAQGALAFIGEVGALAELEMVPGAFELPLAAQTAAFTGRYHAIVALGAVIRGETDHYEHIARETARGLMDASLTTGVPVAFGVLTVTKKAHAVARSRPDRHNKGREAAAAAIEAVHLLRKLSTPSASPKSGK
jgi:6,7-dimethyl-8-ribityllumazine synthase